MATDGTVCTRDSSTTRVCLISTLKNKLSIIYAIKTLYIQAIFLGPVISCTFVLLSKYIM